MQWSESLKQHEVESNTTLKTVRKYNTSVNVLSYVPLMKTANRKLNNESSLCSCRSLKNFLEYRYKCKEFFYFMEHHTSTPLHFRSTYCTLLHLSDSSSHKLLYT